ncbi:MAG: hypothetical protein AAF288_07400 [Planctomycetota bacterium]
MKASAPEPVRPPRFCPACGYDLHGHAPYVEQDEFMMRCSECGKQSKLHELKRPCKPISPYFRGSIAMLGAINLGNASFLSPWLMFSHASASEGSLWIGISLFFASTSSPIIILVSASQGLRIPVVAITAMAATLFLFGTYWIIPVILSLAWIPAAAAGCACLRIAGYGLWRRR